ncbi:hypothetical protein GCM10009836_54950 [Pseudonocardia ailaonensis]|uniref:DUF559 domain-containing protein n=1 Tax=Pseudonocardia ailaonensis TaxID=367279 RepID=A0ABN2NH82_9PSEU
MTIQPFRGSTAVAAGRVTRARLRGPAFLRVFPDVYVPVGPGAGPPDLALRARAAAVVVEGRGVVGGWAAAELLGASCGPQDAAVEVVVPAGSQRPQAGLVVRRGRLGEDEILLVGGVRTTSFERTAFDLACRLPVREGVVAVDALARVGGFEPQVLLRMRNRHLGARGSARVPEVVARADRRSGSPMETRIRLTIADAGLPLPVLQHPVGPYELDLAYPLLRLGIEHNGSDHLVPERALRDLRREAYLARQGWRIIRFASADILNRPHTVAARIRGELGRDRHESHDSARHSATA